MKGLAVDPSLDTKGAMAISFGKKPFDWMTDTQWQMLLVSDWDKKTVFETLDCQLPPVTDGGISFWMDS